MSENNIDINSNKVDEVFSNYSIKTIWSNINISTLLFLKLLEKDIGLLNDDISKSAISKDTGYKCSIHYLAYEYGLINTYINSDNKSLILLFDTEICNDNKNITKSNYETFIDRLVDSELYESSYLEKGILHIIMRIPDIYIEDINKIITDSKYSNVSEKFISAMKNISNVTPVSSNLKIRYIISKNIPYKIVLKHKSLQQELAILFSNVNTKTNLPEIELSDKEIEDLECYTKFNFNNEYYSKKELLKYVR